MSSQAGAVLRTKKAGHDPDVRLLRADLRTLPAETPPRGTDPEDIS